jgi:hypothetical protein
MHSSSIPKPARTDINIQVEKKVKTAKNDTPRTKQTNAMLLILSDAAQKLVQAERKQATARRMNWMTLPKKRPIEQSNTTNDVTKHMTQDTKVNMMPLIG